MLILLLLLVQWMVKNQVTRKLLLLCNHVVPPDGNRTPLDTKISQTSTSELQGQEKKLS